MIDPEKARRLGLKSAPGYRKPKRMFNEQIAIYVIAAIIVAGVFCVHGAIVYDDWTCGFKRCVEVKP